MTGATRKHKHRGGSATANGRRPRKPSFRPAGPGDAIRLSDVIEAVAPQRLRPATVNDKIYKPVRRDDPSIVELAKDIAAKGQVLEALVATQDDVIVSGHRRREAALVARVQTVPVRRINIVSADPRFENYLVSFNQQRVKTVPEQLREAIVRTSPDDAMQTLLDYRVHDSWRAYERVEGAGLRTIEVLAARRRSEISAAKRPMLEAALAVIEQYRDYWPLTLRQIHYRLLTRDVLRNARDPGSAYDNTVQSYKDLSNLLTRARLAYEVPWQSMHDPTRPMASWEGWGSVGAYAREQLDGFLCGYRRDLLQSQPAYVEFVVEKITAQEIAERAAGYYHVPVTVGRGYSSVSALGEVADRFHASGKEAFTLLIAGDLDPEGENICETWAGCLHDEHCVQNLTTVKVAVNPDQVGEHDLAPLPVKETSSRVARFRRAHGNDVYELEAFEPDVLQEIIADAIESVLDMDRFDEERRQEAEDARYLVAARKQVQELLKDCDFGER